jgi:cytochrome c553
VSSRGRLGGRLPQVWRFPQGWRLPLNWRLPAGVLGIALLSAGPVDAADTPPPADAPTAPKTAAVAPPCDACHGAHGEGLAAAHVPRIAGQSAEYLKKQLDDYAQGTRDNPIMTNFAKQLSTAQREKLAQQYSAMHPPIAAQPTSLKPAQLARGHQLAYQGDEQLRVQACNSCHGPDGVGVLHAAPYLAGQSAEFIASSLKAFQDGTRKNDAGELMRSVAKQLKESDIAAVSGYFSTIGQ